MLPSPDNNPGKIGILIPVLQMRILRLGQAKWLAQGHSASG